MSTSIVGAEHQFHSKEFARGWAERFSPTPERIRLFELICSQLKTENPGNGTIIELGIGPGYLASYLLERMPAVSYIGIDFSSPMLEIARERLAEYASRVTYLQADLVADSWDKELPAPADAIVSTWALHDLGSPANVNAAYQRSYDALREGGVFLNGDFVKPDGARQEFEGGRFPIAEHFRLLDSAGFSNATCLATFEIEIENPTPAQNYACLKAER